MADEILERINAWRASGLIDDTTAARLKAAETVAGAAGPQSGAGTALQAASAMFGPPVAITELFAYVGAGFLLAAWHVLAPDVDFAGPPNLLDLSIRWLIPALAFAAIGLAVRHRSPRLGRAAGVAFAIATIHAGGLFDGVLRPAYVSLESVFVAGLTVAVAAAFRRLHAAVLTQTTLVAALLYLAVVALRWLDLEIFGLDTYGRPMTAAALGAGLTLAWWLGWAILLGVLARLEWRIGDDAPPSTNAAEAAAARRGRVTRLLAGVTAVIGATIAATSYGPDGRALSPWLGDLAILAVSAGLLVIAIRFGALAYLLPAALGFIVALTDLNSQYVVERTGIGAALVIEGLILIGTGIVADRLRRTLAGRRIDSGPPPADPPAAAAEATPAPT